MPIFGQVWLWSLAAFLLGAILTWVLVVLPVRRRISALESRLAAVRADVKVSAAAERARAAEPAGPSAAQGMVPGFGDPVDEIRAESLTRAYALPGVQNVPSVPYGEAAEERGALSLSAETGVVGEAPVEPGPGRDWFDEQTAEPDRRLVDDEDADEDEERGTVFTQRTTPIPAALIRQLDESPSPEPESTGAHARSDDKLVDDLADEGAPAAVTTALPIPPPQPQTRPEPEPAARPAAFEPVRLGTNGTSRPEPEETPAEPDPEPLPATRGHRSTTVAELTSRSETETRLVSGLSAEPERSQTALPKRVPAKPQHRHPFGVQTVTPAVSLSTASATGSERLRSLFEPIIPAESGQSETPPPPHRLQASSSTGSRPSAPGPFGPGSAMPLPGGASPSPEFTVKASVTALRYCTPESPQFGRTVAEVWFRTAADAERVGFRPVG
jgi:hypothetical protein